MEVRHWMEFETQSGEIFRICCQAFYNDMNTIVLGKVLFIREDWSHTIGLFKLDSFASTTFLMFAL